MKKTYSLNELIALAAVVFQEEKNSNVNKVYASEDGFVFIEENRAKVHCKNIENLKYHTITRTEALQTVEEPDAVIDTGEKSGSKDPEAEKELEALKAQYLELYGKPAHHNIGAEKLKTLIAEKLDASKEGEGTEGTNKQPE